MQAVLQATGCTLVLPCSLTWTMPSGWQHSMLNICHRARHYHCVLLQLMQAHLLSTLPALANDSALVRRSPMLPTLPDLLPPCLSLRLKGCSSLRPGKRNTAVEEADS